MLVSWGGGDIDVGRCCIEFLGGDGVGVGVLKDVIGGLDGEEVRFALEIFICYFYLKGVCWCIFLNVLRTCIGGSFEFWFGFNCICSGGV